jgi:hypothetical protein
MSRHLLAAAAAAAIVAVAGCSSNSNSTTTSPTPTGPTTDSFSSHVAPNGLSSHTFITSANGTVTATLSTLAPAVTVGFGVGVPPGVGTGGCNLTRTLETAGGADSQITISADRGTYCVEIYDVGNLIGAVGPTGQAGYTITVVHP